MSVNAIGCGVIAPRKPQKNPNDVIRDRMERRLEVKFELRYRELCEKEKNGTLTKEEKLELKALQAARNLDKLSQIPTVVYVA